MITFHMRREGQFTANFGTRNGQCGTGGQQIYSYVCEIVVGPKLDAQGFILDNYKVQGYFDREYSSKADAGPAQSCERMAELAASHFAALLTSQGREVKRVSCTVSGSALAGLTAVWEPETVGNPWKDEIVEACVVNHLSWDDSDPRKTLVNLIKWEVQVALDPKVSREALALIDQGIERAKNDPATTLFGRSLTEVQAALNEYDSRRTKPVSTELVCDHCKQPIELDGGNLRYGNERQDYWHKLADGGHSYSCSVGSTQATRNGRDWETVGIVETVQLPEPKPVVCDHCHRAVRKSQSDPVDRWEHADNGLLHCDIDSVTNNNRATVNGSLYVDGRKEPTPEPAPKTIKRCDHCGKEIEPGPIYWQHKSGRMHTFLCDNGMTQAEFNGSDLATPEAA